MERTCKLLPRKAPGWEMILHLFLWGDSSNRWAALCLISFWSISVPEADGLRLGGVGVGGKQVLGKANIKGSQHWANKAPCLNYTPSNLQFSHTLVLSPLFSLIPAEWPLSPPLQPAQLNVLLIPGRPINQKGKAPLTRSHLLSQQWHLWLTSPDETKCNNCLTQKQQRFYPTNRMYL